MSMSVRQPYMIRDSKVLWFLLVRAYSMKTPQRMTLLHSLSNLHHRDRRIRSYCISMHVCMTSYGRNLPQCHKQ
jgi:hypothetical protein